MIINDNVDAFSAKKSQEHGLKELLEKVVSEIEEKKPSVPRPISAFQFCCIEIWGSNWRKKMATQMWGSRHASVPFGV